jgi:NADPH:quinone reductase-like Zn-dependent oxidoreductase
LVYVTVGSGEELKGIHPMDFGINEDHAFSLHDKNSAKETLAYNGGKGVDVILSNVRDQSVHQFWQCIAMCGRYIEFGNPEALGNGKARHGYLRGNTAFASLDL